MRRWPAIVGLLLFAAGCRNDYDRFAVSGDVAGGSGGSSASGGSGAGGSEPGGGGSHALGGAAGGSGAGGTGASSGGGAAGDATGTGGASGAAGAGGGSCELMCGAECTIPGDANCGGCDNDCTAQGHSGGFACGSGVCGCTQANQCRDASGGSVSCLIPGGAAVGVCVCGATACAPGEVCRRVLTAQRCSCNSGEACAAGQTCCQTPAGCKDLRADDENCGACGNACPDGTTCSNGRCQ